MASTAAPFYHQFYGHNQRPSYSAPSSSTNFSQNSSNDAGINPSSSPSSSHSSNDIGTYHGDPQPLPALAFNHAIAPYTFNPNLFQPSSTPTQAGTGPSSSSPPLAVSYSHRRLDPVGTFNSSALMSTDGTSEGASHVWVKRVLDRNQACLSCRGKKKKCDGVRPICGNCFRLDRICVFSHSEDKQPLLGQQRKRACASSTKRNVRQKTTDDLSATAIRDESAIAEDANRQTSNDILAYNYGDAIPEVSEALGVSAASTTNNTLTLAAAPARTVVGELGEIAGGFFQDSFSGDILDFNIPEFAAGGGFIDTGSSAAFNNFIFPPSPSSDGFGFPAIFDNSSAFTFLDLDRDPANMFNAFLNSSSLLSIPPSIDVSSRPEVIHKNILQDRYPPIDKSIINSMTRNGTFPPPKQILDQLVDIFFTHYHPFMPFLHRNSFVRDIEPGGPLHSPTVLSYSVLSLACRSHPQAAISSLSKQWHRKSKDLFDWCTANGKFSLENVQGAIWNCYHAIISAQLCEAWIILAKAYRMATPLELHKLDARGTDLRSILTPLWGPMRLPRGRLEEEARRTFWAILMLDRWASLPASWPMCLSSREFKLDLPVEDEVYQEMTDEDVLPWDCSEPYVYDLERFVQATPYVPRNWKALRLSKWGEERKGHNTNGNKEGGEGVGEDHGEVPIRGALHYSYKLSVLWGRIIEFNTDPHIEFCSLHSGDSNSHKLNEYTRHFRQLESALARMRTLLIAPRKIRLLTAQITSPRNPNLAILQKDLFVELAMELKLQNDIETATIMLWHPIVMAYRLQEAQLQTQAQSQGPHMPTREPQQPQTGPITKLDYETAFNICLHSVENILSNLRSYSSLYGNSEGFGAKMGSYVHQISFFWQPMLAPTYLLGARVLVAKWQDFKDRFFEAVVRERETEKQMERVKTSSFGNANGVEIQPKAEMDNNLPIYTTESGMPDDGFSFYPSSSPSSSSSSSPTSSSASDYSETAFSFSSSPSPPPIETLEASLEHTRQKISSDLNLIMSAFEKFTSYSENLGKAYCGMLSIEMAKLGSSPITRHDVPVVGNSGRCPHGSTTSSPSPSSNVYSSTSGMAGYVPSPIKSRTPLDIYHEFKDGHGSKSVWINHRIAMDPELGGKPSIRKSARQWAVRSAAEREDDTDLSVLRRMER